MDLRCVEVIDMNRITIPFGRFKRVVSVFLFLVAVVMLLSSGSYTFDRMYGNDHVQSSRDSIAEVRETTVVPQVYSSGVETTVVTPVASVSDPLSTSADSSYSLPSLLPNIMPAFAIPSDQITVTSTEWAVPTKPPGALGTSSYPHGVAVDSSGNVYFTEKRGNKIGRLDPSTNVINN